LERVRGMVKKPAQAEGEAVDTGIVRPADTSQVGGATVADIGATLADEMPAPSPQVMDAAVTDPPPAAPQPEPPKRGRGRPPGSGKKNASKVGTLSGSPQAGNAAIPPQDQTAAIAMSAGALTSITLLAGTIIGGPDFAPGPNPLVGGKNDQDFLQAAYFDYCKAKGVQDVPPGVALTAALMIYITPRLSRPATQTRLGKLGEFFGKIWLKIRKRSNGHAARVIGGNDRERQIDTREAA
jgi:hypothetical protein